MTAHPWHKLIVAQFRFTVLWRLPRASIAHKSPQFDVARKLLVQFLILLETKNDISDHGREREVAMERCISESDNKYNSKVNCSGKIKKDGRGSVSRNRGGQGFSLVEQLLSLLIVAFAAVLLIRMNAANAVISQHSARRMSAVRLGSELSAWIQRGGHAPLGTPIEQALDQLQTASVTSDTSTMCCPPDGCDAGSSAWWYLALWRSRLIRSIPDARVMICAGEANGPSVTDWSCESRGSVLLLKLGWPMTVAMPSIVMPLGSVR